MATNVKSNSVCTHQTMVRFYATNARCSLCNQNHSSQYIYVCTQDRELILEQQLRNGQESNPEGLSQSLSQCNDPKKWSPAARADPTSVLEEMGEEQKSSYTPEQLAKLVEQRENVARAILQSCELPAEGTSSLTLSNAIQQEHPRWYPQDACKFKCCTRCRNKRSCTEKSYLSIDAIVNGDIPATAETGYGFEMLGGRPVSDANIVKTIGLRPNPNPLPKPSAIDASDTTESTVVQVYGTQNAAATREPLGLGIFTDNQEAKPNTSIPEPPRPSEGNSTPAKESADMTSSNSVPKDATPASQNISRVETSTIRGHRRTPRQIEGHQLYFVSNPRASDNMETPTRRTMAAGIQSSEHESFRRHKRTPRQIDGVMISTSESPMRANVTLRYGVVDDSPLTNKGNATATPRSLPRTGRNLPDFSFPGPMSQNEPLSNEQPRQVSLPRASEQEIYDLACSLSLPIPTFMEKLLLSENQSSPLLPMGEREFGVLEQPALFAVKGESSVREDGDGLYDAYGPMSMDR